MDSLISASDGWWFSSGETPRYTIIVALTGWVGARVVICPAMAMLELLWSRNFVINPPICVQIDRKPVTMTDGHHQGSTCLHKTVITSSHCIRHLKRYNDHLFIDPFKGNICNFAGTEGKESPCWLGLIRPMSLLTSYWSRQLLIIVSIFQMSLFPEVGTNGTPAPRRVHATTLISVAQSNINDSSFMFPGFYSAIQI